MITVVVRDEGNVGYEQVLLYTVDADPKDEAAVHAAVCAERAKEIDGFDDEDSKKIILMFAFDGDLTPVMDWR